MFTTLEPLLEHLVNPDQVAADEGMGVQPQAGKSFASQETLPAERQRLVFAVAKHVPGNCLLGHTPDQVLANFVSPIDLELGFQVEARRAGGHFRRQLRRTGNTVISINKGMPASLRLNEKHAVGLRLVVHVQAYGAGNAAVHAGRMRAVDTHPSDEIKMRPTML